MSDQMTEHKTKYKEMYEEKNATIVPLVEKAVAGDDEAMHSLCEMLGGNILFRAKYMLGKTMNEMDAEDVTQEVLLSICKNIGALREPKAFNKWLSSIITHEANRYAKMKNNKGFMLI